MLCEWARVIPARVPAQKDPSIGGIGMGLPDAHAIGKSLALKSKVQETFGVGLALATQKTNPAASSRLARPASRVPSLWRWLWLPTQCPSATTCPFGPGPPLRAQSTRPMRRRWARKKQSLLPLAGLRAQPQSAFLVALALGFNPQSQGLTVPLPLFVVVLCH